MPIPQSAIDGRRFIECRTRDPAYNRKAWRELTGEAQYYVRITLHSLPEGCNALGDWKAKDDD